MSFCTEDSVPKHSVGLSTVPDTDGRHEMQVPDDLSAGGAEDTERDGDRFGYPWAC